MKNIFLSFSVATLLIAFNSSYSSLSRACRVGKVLTSAVSRSRKVDCFNYEQLRCFGVSRAHKDSEIIQVNEVEYNKMLDGLFEIRQKKFNADIAELQEADMMNEQKIKTIRRRLNITAGVGVTLIATPVVFALGCMLFGFDYAEHGPRGGRY